MLFVDTNIWCYYFDQSASEHASVARAVDKVLSKERLVMNTVVMMEVAHYLTKSLGAVQGQEKMKVLQSFPFQVHDFDQELLRESIDQLATHTHVGIGGRDATILATMKKHGIRKLMTHDVAFKRVDWIEVVDPAI